jgi:hypothetical protein
VAFDGFLAGLGLGAPAALLFLDAGLPDRSA